MSGGRAGLAARPDPADPPGPDSTFSFNPYGPSPNDDVVLRWDEETPGGGPGVLAGRSVGHQVGGAVWAKALIYFNGTAT